LRARISSAAQWSIAIRMIERLIGFASTMVLARLLTPADFGVVAMGMAVFAIINTVTEFGFTQALIRHPGPDHEAYDTALTLNVLTGALVAVALLIAIPVAQSWYEDARVGWVLAGLAMVSFTLGWRSVGLIRLERELNFKPIFQVMAARKIFAVAVGIGVAWLYGDYRALLAGMFAGAAVEVGMSYWLGPRRLRLTLSRYRQLLGFSVWWMLNQAAVALTNRGRDFLVGARLGPGPLGQYSVALELAILPTSELVAPLMRALFPGYVEMRNETGRLYAAFVRVWAVVALVVVPAAAGMACLGPLIAHVVLGPQWTEAGALLRLLAFFGAVLGLGHSFWPLMLTQRGPGLVFAFTFGGMAVTLPVFAFMLWHVGLAAAIAASILAGALVLVATAGYMVRVLDGHLRDLLAGLARPTVASALMAGGLVPLASLVPAQAPWGFAAAALIALVVGGALVYIGAVWTCWRLAGAHPGAESDLLAAANHWLKRRRPGAEVA
jgi:O-antigen/teichoic acid export membrane protein